MKRAGSSVLVAATTALAIVSSPAIAQERVRANVSCVSGAVKLAYECKIKLVGAKSGVPVAGADVTVGADMPSMPGAHNVKPIKATLTGEPGAYQVKLALEMHGEWALKISVAGPIRDVVIHHMRFE